MAPEDRDHIIAMFNDNRTSDLLLSLNSGETVRFSPKHQAWPISGGIILVTTDVTRGTTDYGRTFIVRNIASIEFVTAASDADAA